MSEISPRGCEAPELCGQVCGLCQEEQALLIFGHGTGHIVSKAFFVIQILW